MTYEPIRDGDLAAVVTFLEMKERPKVDVPSAPLSLHRIEQPDLDDYRQLFRQVGAPWLWFSRLIMTDDTLRAIVHDPGVELFAVVNERGDRVGMLELDYRETARCELSFLGLVPEMSGQGHGRWLLAEALRLAWRDGIERVHVHTCTLDHRPALRATAAAGFTPNKRAIERFPDPRLLGILPSDCAPQSPVLGTDGSTSRPAT